MLADKYWILIELNTKVEKAENGDELNLSRRNTNTHQHTLSYHQNQDNDDDVGT